MLALFLPFGCNFFGMKILGGSCPAGEVDYFPVSKYDGTKDAVASFEKAKTTFAAFQAERAAHADKETTLKPDDAENCVRRISALTSIQMTDCNGKNWFWDADKEVLETSDGRKTIRETTDRCKEFARAMKTAVHLPVPATRDPEIERAILAAMRKWRGDKYKDVALYSTDWSIERNSQTGIIVGRSRWFYVTTQDGQKCGYQVHVASQQYVGNEFTGPFDLSNIVGFPHEVDCSAMSEWSRNSK